MVQDGEKMNVKVCPVHVAIPQMHCKAKIEVNSKTLFLKFMLLVFVLINKLCFQKCSTKLK